MPTALHESRTRERHQGLGCSVWALACTTLRTLTAALATERQAQQAIRELESFDDRRLRDLGLTRADIRRAVRFGWPSRADTPPPAGCDPAANPPPPEMVRPGDAGGQRGA